MFSQHNGEPFARYPQTESTNMFSFSGSWMLGVVKDTIYANRNVSVDEPQMWAGPIDTITNLPKDAIDWAKVWEISRSEVEYHQLHYTDEGYVVPEHIKNWPARHEDNNVNAYLAPFFDINANGIYDPVEGDYPSFSGDEAAYFIANDLYGENIFPKSHKLGIEFQGLVYTYDDLIQEGIVYVKLYVINRSTHDYAPFYYGQYVDYQAGNPTDNVVATDVTKSVVYAYNGDNDDEGPLGYGSSQLPAAGCVFLNRSLYSSTSFQMSDTNRNYPMTEQEMQWVMEGKWRTGNPKYAGGNGVKEIVGKETRYIYPKMTDQTVADQNWTDGNGASAPGMRNSLSVIRFEQLKSKSFKRIDYAFVVELDAEDPESGLLYKAQQARVFYEKYLPTEEVAKPRRLVIYPNPVQLSAGVELNINATTAELWSLNGFKICDLKEKTPGTKKFEIPCNETMASGVYLVKALSEAGISVGRIVVVAD